MLATDLERTIVCRRWGGERERERETREREERDKREREREMLRTVLSVDAVAIVSGEVGLHPSCSTVFVWPMQSTIFDTFVERTFQMAAVLSEEPVPSRVPVLFHPIPLTASR